jgi:type IV pilus assembly protein PilQ
VDLTTAVPYQITRDGSAVVIFFEGSNPSAEPDVTSAQADVTRPEFHYAVSAPRTHALKSVRLTAPRFPLPAQLTQSSAALGMFGGAAPAKPDGQQAAQQAAQQAGSAAATMAANSPTAGNPQGGKYTGEPISVNLKDVDLRDFFRLIHEISGLNVILDPAVKGTLTIVLDEVPWDQALDIVLQNNGLDKQLSGNVLRIATRDTLKKEAETTRDLEKAQAEAVAPVTVTRVLSYSKAVTMKDTLKKFLSARGDILSDDRSNQLIIRDIPSVIPVIDNLIRQLDRKSQQVEIEARVVSASRSFAQDIGTELGFAGSMTHGRSLFSGTPAVGGSGSTGGAGVPPAPVSIGAGSLSGNGITTGLPLVTNLSATAPTSGFGFSHRSPNFALDFFITAAEAKGVGKLLSKPRVVTQNNEKAIVKQGTKIPIQTTINNTISVQFIDAVLKLEVTPQITAEGTVFMDVLVENTQIDNGIQRVQGVPALNTQSAETKILVGDGQTFVVGGIIISSQRVDITQVPLVGSLPIIGHLFRRTNVNVNSQELLFFLTPRIIPG